MLISPNKTKSNTTEWEQFEQLEKPVSSLDHKNTLKFKADTQVLDEYGRLINSITAEYIRQTEIFSKLQQSNADIFFNSISMWYNFFHLNVDMNTKLADYTLSKVFYF